MKIIILSDSFPPEGFGGAEVVAYNLAYALSDKDHQVQVITTTKDRNNVGTFKDKNLTIHKIYSDYDLRFRAYKSLNNRKVVKEVSRIIKDNRPDVVHAHNIHTHISYASLKEAKKYSGAVFLTVHDVMSVHYGKLGATVNSSGDVVIDSINPIKQFLQYRLYYNPFRNIFIHRYLKSVDKIFSVSLALKKVLEKQGILEIEVLHNGVDGADWSINERVLVDFKQKYNPENKKVLFFGGRLSQAKGGSVIVDVLKQVSLKVKDVFLLVVGDENKSTEDMIKKANHLGIKDRIVFTGRMEHENIRYAYVSSDIVFVLSQYVDPFPTVNLEAMVCKKPVIGTMFGGTREVVLNNKTGYIINPMDVDLISKKTIQLLEDTEKAREFGLSGYNRVSSNFSQDDWTLKTISSYVKILLKKK